ncbi:hypothetical protein ACFXDJ_06500 [Streptomyces sp. NPDC059443]|uniref:hypothetical protein n=1 Tax=unclassified Streptomyces TaxID=2593676 RepID=UPI0036C199FC
MRRLLKVVSVLSLLLCLFGIFLVYRHSGATPECGGKPMSPGDVCRHIGGNGGGSDTYEELQASLEGSVPIDRGIAYVSGAVFIASVAARMALRRSANGGR